MVLPWSRFLVCKPLAMEVIQVVLLVIVAAAAVECQVPFWGRCPYQPVKQNFQVPWYLGRWYEQEKYFAIFQAGGKCVTADYTDRGNGVVGVLNSQVSTKTNRYSFANGTATVASPSGEGKLRVRFSPSDKGTEANYLVLETDYISYSVVWSCTEILGHMNLQFLWVLTREKTPSSQLLSHTRGVIGSRYLSAEPLMRTTQDCDN